MTLAPIRDEHDALTAVSAVIRDNSWPVRQARYRDLEREVVGALESAHDATGAAVGTLRGVGRGLGCELGALWRSTAPRMRCA